MPGATRGRRVRPEGPMRKRDETGSRPGLARAADAVFERGQLLDADRPARMHPAGGDADLGAEAELAAIGELGRGVVQHDGRIDLGQEALGGRRVVGDDRIGVMGAVRLDMVDGRVEPSTTRTEMMASRYSVRQSSSVAAVTRGSAAWTASSPRTAQAGIEQAVTSGCEMRRGAGPVDEQGLGRAADAGAAHLGVEHDAPSPCRDRPCRAT